MATVPTLSLIVSLWEDCWTLTIGRWKIGLFRRTARGVSESDPKGDE